MDMPRLLPAQIAARCLGVTPQTLRGWRRRGIGPAYTCLPGGNVRRGRAAQYWDGKAYGTIMYPLDGLREFIARLSVQAGRLPRPTPGRLPGGENTPKVQTAD
jgi:hypothetical protein